MDFPLKYFHKNIVITNDFIPMAVYQLPQSAYNFKYENVKKMVPRRLEEVLNVFSGRGQLLYLTRPVSIDEGTYLADAGCYPKTAEIMKEAHNHATDAIDYLNTLRSWKRETYIALELPLPEKVKVEMINSVKDIKSQIIEMFLATKKRVITPQLLQEIEIAENELSMQISPTLGTEPVTFSDIDWLIRRNLYRSDDIPPPLPARESGFFNESMVLALGDGVTYEEKSTMMALTTPSGEIHYQSFMHMVDVPTDISELNVEWLSFLNFLSVPVDAVVYFECEKNIKAKKTFKKKSGMLKDQIREYNDSNEQTTHEIDVAEEQEPILEAKLSSGMGLVKFGCTLCVSAKDLRELRSAVKIVQQKYSNFDFRLVRAPGDQLKMFYSFIPGAKPGGPLIPCDPLYLAAAGVQASFDVGDKKGFVIGHMLNGIPVLFKPGDAMLRNRSGAVLELGTLGGGKTNLKFLLIYLAALKGARIITINSKAEDHVLELLPFKSRQVDLSYTGNARINPLTIANDPLKARDIARDFLCITLKVGDNESRLLAIVEALDKVYSLNQEKWHLDSVLNVLETMQDADENKINEARRCSNLLKAYKMSSLGRMVFTKETTSFDGDEQITSINLAGLPLPGKNKKPEDPLTESERQSIGLMYLAAVAAKEVLLKYDVKALKVYSSDENWKLEFVNEGKLLTNEIILMGRSMNIIPIISTQNNSHLDDDTKKNIGYVFAFHTEDLDEIKANADLLQIDADNNVIETFRQLRTGTCFMKDLDNRVSVVKITLLPRYLKQIFDTTPKEDQKVVGT
ncbi:ATP-binding protein [Peptococcaceae bacterium 1198_IL3148]